MPPTHTDESIGRSLVQSYAVNDRMNQVVLKHLDPRAWSAKLPGSGGRTMAAIFSHMHNIRRKWLRLSAPHLKLPELLDRHRCTQQQASLALAESASRCCEMLTEALVQPCGGMDRFQRDGWAKPWPVGAEMVAYMLSHDAHHRGQVCMLAHQLGFPLPVQASSEMWSWETLWKDCRRQPVE